MRARKWPEKYQPALINDLKAADRLVSTFRAHHDLGVQKGAMELDTALNWCLVELMSDVGLDDLAGALADVRDARNGLDLAVRLAEGVVEVEEQAA